ncbi:HEAT repeat domain-containing protein [Tundrisphaera lichenicola]|uniref:HEAT repeat domain-containing protein n=1 Tax=Tundrisphaera lichenicola TaxID=2029860 RepID=UPI003EC139FC
MSTTRHHSRLLMVLGALGAAGLTFQPGESRADRITLRGGGQVRGKLVADEVRPDVLVFVGEVGKTPIVFKKEQIVQVVAEQSPLDEYVIRRAKPRTTAELEYELGTWCEENELPDLARYHYEFALKRDSTFGPSHEKLGHVLRDGRWLNAEELKESQGFIKYKGRWITPEEKQRKEDEQAIAAEGAAWIKQLRFLRDAYLSGPEERTREAERRLLSIVEPAAISPVLRVLGSDSVPAIRIMASRILGKIPGPIASTGLVGRLTNEPDEEVRQATMDEIARRTPSEVVPGLTRALRANSAEVVNRAAWGLGNLNALSTVPKLVPALVTVETRVMMPGIENNSSGNFNVSFNAVSPAPEVGNYGGISIPVLTPPAVGQGAVGFGATSVPYGALNAPNLNTGTVDRGPTPRMVSIKHHNAEVLAALVKMTGEDFGYDVATWNRWVASSFRIDSAPARRVPQP